MEKKFQFTVPDPLGGPSIVYSGIAVAVIRVDGDFDGYAFKELKRDGIDILPELGQLTPIDRTSFEWRITLQIGY